MLIKFILPENCKFDQAKLMNSVVFASVSPSIRSIDIKLKKSATKCVKNDCFTKLLSAP